LTAFVQRMPGNLAFMQVQRPYLWDRHVTLKSFFRLLLQGDAAGEMSNLSMMLYLATALLLAAAVIACVWQIRRRGDDEFARDRIISITILTMPLLMPFYFDYDLLLLAVPAVLAGARGDRARPDRTACDDRMGRAVRVADRQSARGGDHARERDGDPARDRRDDDDGAGDATRIGDRDDASPVRTYAAASRGGLT
jgi:hypothetical protein